MTHFQCSEEFCDNLRELGDACYEAFRDLS